MMDFLDPKKSRAHTVRLIIGYVLVAIALALATTVLLYMADGFGVKQGKVIQNGLVFISSSPSGSSIYLNGELQDNATTNAKLVLPAGTYTMRLSRDGYRDWQRAVTVEGGSVDRFDYPLLIAKTLTTALDSTYSSAPPLVTQSPDRRWLLVQQPGGPATFDVYDVKDPKKVKSEKKTITLPATAAALPLTAASSMKLVEWSNDNSHVLLQHIVGNQSEYILLSRDKPEESLNLTRQLQLSKTAVLTMQDKKYDHYFVHDPANLTLGTTSLADVRIANMVSGVISYKTYGSNVVLYTTAADAEAGKVSAKLYQDGTTYPIRQLAKDDSYLLDISRYSGSWYAAVGSPSENHVYIYQDPSDRLSQDNKNVLAPIYVMKLDKPNYIEFSANSQFIMGENGQDLAVFDFETVRSYVHHLDRPIDAPQSHVSWMDSYHLRLVSGGAATIFDYDGTNVQTLAANGSAYLPMFDTGYTNLYAIAPATESSQAGQVSLTATPLRTLKDQ